MAIKPLPIYNPQNPPRTRTRFVVCSKSWRLSGSSSHTKSIYSIGKFSSIALQKCSYKSFLIKSHKWLCYSLCRASAPDKLQTSSSNKYYFQYCQKTFGTNQFATDDLRKTQKFYELILIDTNFVSITHTFNKYHPAQIPYSKCIIRSILNSQQWKSPFQEHKFFNFIYTANIQL